MTITNLHYPLKQNKKFIFCDEYGRKKVHTIVRYGIILLTQDILYPKNIFVYFAIMKARPVRCHRWYNNPLLVELGFSSFLMFLCGLSLNPLCEHVQALKASKRFMTVYRVTSVWVI